VPIIRRKKCIYAPLGTCYSVWMTVWYAGWNEKKNEHIVARNMQRLINIVRNKGVKKNCALRWLYLQDCTVMHGQENIKCKLFKFYVQLA